jgi:hypothetical protein
LENPKGGDHSEDLSADGNIIDLRETRWAGVDWSHLIQDEDQW